MSYDLYLCYVPAGYTFDAAYDALDDGTLPVLDAPKEVQLRRKWSIFKTLFAKNPTLEVFPREAKDFLKQSEADLDTDLTRITRSLELHDEEGITIAIYDDCVCISAVYQCPETVARAMFGKIRAYLHIIQEYSNYSICDGQLSKIIDPDNDLEAMVAAYLTI